MRVSSSFALKLLVRDVYSCDIASWDTEDKATFEYNGRLKFDRVWLQARHPILRVSRVEGFLEGCKFKNTATKLRPRLNLQRPTRHLLVSGRCGRGSAPAHTVVSEAVHAFCWLGVNILHGHCCFCHAGLRGKAARGHNLHP